MSNSVEKKYIKNYDNRVLTRNQFKIKSLCVQRNIIKN